MLIAWFVTYVWLFLIVCDFDLVIRAFVLDILLIVGFIWLEVLVAGLLRVFIFVCALELLLDLLAFEVFGCLVGFWILLLLFV